MLVQLKSLLLLNLSLFMAISVLTVDFCNCPVLIFKFAAFQQSIAGQQSSSTLTANFSLENLLIYMNGERYR